MIIKIYGLPRTCTNLTEVLIKKNFKCRVLNNHPDWKHGFSTITGIELRTDKVRTNDLKFVICTKHPHNWLWSLFTFENKRWDKHRASMDFLKKVAWHYRKMDMNAIEAFNKLTKHWLELSNNPKTLQVVKQEDLINDKDQTNFCRRLESSFSLKKKIQKFEPIKKIIRPGTKTSSEEYKTKTHGFNKKEINYINSKLDKNVVEMAGYKI